MEHFTGIEWIMIDASNRWGNDKLLWQKRIDWFKDNEHQLDSMVNTADKPILYMKAVRAYRNALQGIAIGHPVALDSTASGIQVMAILMRCETTAKNVNLINTGKREDVYAKVAKVAGEDRATIKKPVMTSFYGSTKQPESIFGKDSDRLANFYSVLASELPGAMRCMEIMQSAWKPDVTHHTFTAPDGHIAYIPVMDTEKKRINIDKTSFTHIANINKPTTKGLSLAANATHMWDGYIVREMIRKANKQGFELITIHDDFACLPNYVNQMRENYKDIMLDLASKPIMVNWLIEMGFTATDDNQTTIDIFVNKLKDMEYMLS